MMVMMVMLGMVMMVMMMGGYRCRWCGVSGSWSNNCGGGRRRVHCSCAHARRARARSQPTRVPALPAKPRVVHVLVTALGAMGLQRHQKFLTLVIPAGKSVTLLEPRTSPVHSEAGTVALEWRG